MYVEQSLAVIVCSLQRNSVTMVATLLHSDPYFV